MNKKNILIFVLDQLTWRALPAYGNTYANTPNINRISDGALIYDECYSACPLCQPSRCAFWSGLYPHDTKVLSNGRQFPVDDLPEDVPTLGSSFRDAGYTCVHFGKRHDAGALRGFDCAVDGKIEFEADDPAWPIGPDSYHDAYCRKVSCEWLEQYDGEKPFIMITDLNNPHNICKFIGDFQGENEGIAPPCELPELPPNFDFPDIKNRPIPVQYICCSHNRQAQVSQWTDTNFRYYLAAYYHYLEMADRDVGAILDVLEKRGFDKDTTVILMADHGDSMVARHRVTKQVDFYEEVTRVPFIVKGSDIVPRHIDNKLISLLDLYPTLCGYAGIEKPSGLRGVDLSCEFLGGEISTRPYVFSEWHTEWGYTISPGRMVRSDKYKYTRYIEGDGEELFDMVNDPYEMKNLVGDEKYAGALNEMRGVLDRHIEETNDDFNSLDFKAAERWRCHKVGYSNHRGIAAPQEY